MRKIKKVFTLLLIATTVICFLVTGTKLSTATEIHCSLLGKDCQTLSVVKQPQNLSAAIASTVQQLLKPSPKVVFFGSSTTVGVGSTRGDRRWTTLLSRYLGWQEINQGLSGSTITKSSKKADSAWRIPPGVERSRQDVLRYKPDLVVMMYGTNDIYRQVPLGSASQDQAGTFYTDVKTLLTTLKSNLPPDRLIVSTPQPSVATQKIRAPYDLALQARVREVGAMLIDAGNEAISPLELPQYVADGLHPNNLGHAAIASFMAGKMADLGLVAPPPEAVGGNHLTAQLVPVKGGRLHIDLDNPLKFGEIRTIEAEWVASGQAVLAVLRPNGRGGYEIIYRTPSFAVDPGRDRIKVPRWWVLDGDRLAVWTQGDCLGSEATSQGTAHHLYSAVESDVDINDVNQEFLLSDSHRLAIWTGK
ncbi:SGNH/GDSL hydrolase family protein [Tolypothrix sp. PCC 7910]|uniref:SGNH/GDSL hydrolase family protein n=1 Tax=Tolypothrix sp. PCC 7910 TaxID=2099387 RepID=UPI0014279E45|nr:SGNH/GDSL hydrolase family protein [Tolypothrix sp. PCC 7910]QIR38123.1 SGNH/GDSL hydrolase family protein [Tolypothrix sp. PCC 7910]